MDHLISRKIKILTAVLGLCFFLWGHAHADTALIQLDSNGRPIALPIPPQTSSTASPEPATSTPTVTSPVQVGSLPPSWPAGYIYYTLPGGINLTTPWSSAILATGWDFIGKETITQGYLPLASWGKFTAVAGGGINGKGEGSPLAGGIVNLANATLTPNADFHLMGSGGYNFNARHALAILSASIQFLY